MRIHIVLNKIQNVNKFSKPIFFLLFVNLNTFCDWVQGILIFNCIVLRTRQDTFQRVPIQTTSEVRFRTKTHRVCTIGLLWFHRSRLDRILRAHEIRNPQCKDNNNIDYNINRYPAAEVKIEYRLLLY